MRTTHASQIRNGILTARKTVSRLKFGPLMAPFTYGKAPKPTLWERAYRRELMASTFRKARNEPVRARRVA